VGRAAVLGFLAFALASTAPGSGHQAPRDLPLLTARNLVYKGAFRLPQQVDARRTFAYGGTALAFDLTRNALFVVGHD